MNLARTGTSLLIALALAASGCGTSTRATPRSPAATTQPTASPAAATTPEAPAADTAGRVYAWGQSRSGRDLKRLTAALQAISAADRDVAGGDIAAAGTSCARLASAVTSAEAGPPIPYGRAEKWYARSLAKFQESAADCQAGVESDDAALVNEGTAALTEGSNDMARVSAAITALDG